MSRRPSLMLGAILLALVATMVEMGPSASAADPAPTPTVNCHPDAAKPGRDYAPPSAAAANQGSFFSYPNRSAGEQVAIRNRVVNTINSTWGTYYSADAPVAEGPCLLDGVPTLSHTYIPSWTTHAGTIRMATWSFNDWGVRDALVRAAARGTSVQILAATGVNREKNYKPWFSTMNYLNSHRSQAAWGRIPGFTNLATQCSGACRGAGGTPHSKYYLFNDVRTSSAARQHQTSITMQTSMNLTAFAFGGQWNAALVFWNNAIYNRFLTIFNQSVKKQHLGYSASAEGGAYNYFYPGGSLRNDVALRSLAPVRCTGATSGGIGGRTRVRVIQYAIYDTRGVALAKRLRALWNAGCNVAIIYSVTSRPVLKILRAKSGRGPVPMKQSVIKNRKGEIVKYNHSKWLAISGYYGSNRGTWTVLSGSANWSNFAYGCDEAMQQVYGAYWAQPFFSAFGTTWAQKTSRKPTSGGSLDGARVTARGTQSSTLGYGQFKYMDND